LRLVFSVTIAFVFLAVGTVVGGVFFVPPGSGLASGPIALSYGIVAALLSAVLAFFFYPKISDLQRKWLWYPVATAAIVIAAVLIRGYTSTQSEQQAYLDDLRRNFPPFELLWLPAGDFARDFISLNVDSRDHSFQIDYANASSCNGLFGDTSTEKGDLLTALRSIEGEVYRNPQLCAAANESSVNRFVYTIHESLPPPNTGNMNFTEQCLEDSPILVEALNSIERVYQRLRRDQQCQ